MTGFTILVVLAIAGAIIVPTSIRVFRQLRWLAYPNHAPLRIDGRWSSRHQIVVRVRNHETAKLWITDPPHLNVNGLEGLAWLAKLGDEVSRELFFEVLLKTDTTYTQVCDAVQNLSVLQHEIIEAVEGRPAN